MLVVSGSSGGTVKESEGQPEPVIVANAPTWPVDPPRPEQGEAGEGQPGEAIEQPAKLLRIASMIRELLEEVRQAPLDEGGRRRLQTVYERSVDELKDVLSENLQKELDALAVPFTDTPSESELRVAQAQLVGWLEGLFHGIQAALWAQQAMARAQFEEIRRRGLPSHATPTRERGDPAGGPPGQYL
jgi:proteasome activator-like protein